MNLNCRYAGTAIWALALALLVPASAQVTGSLSGRVEDPNGMAVVNVRVVLTLHDSDVEEAATTTTGTGAFFFPALRPIYYDLRVEAPNFKTQTLTNVKIDPTSETSLPPTKLELGDVKTTVEAKAPTQTLQTSSAEVASTLTQEQVTALPLFARDPLQPLGLLDTLPGVESNGRGLNPTTIDGQSVSFANITYDGINIQDNFIRNLSLNSNDVFLGLHTDQISEVTIVTSNPGTIYTGGSSQVAFSTPSGGNLFHGSAYWLNIPRGISAQYFQSNADSTPSTVQLNQAGGAVGGPILKNKLFYFLNFESDQDRSTVTQIGFLPTTPLSSQNPTVEQILKLIPSPNGYVGTGLDLGANYATPRNNGNTTYLGLARLDYVASSKHVFSFSASMNESLQDDPGDSSPFGAQPGAARQSDVTLQTVATFLSGSWRWSATPRLTNEVRIGMSLQRLDFMNSLRAKYPYIFNFVDANGNQLGLQPMAGADPQGQNNRIYNYQDNLTYVKSNHSFHAGFSLQQYREGTYGINNGNLSSVTLPTYTLDTTGLVTQEIQPFGFSSPTSGYQAHVPPVSKPSANLISGYFQDNWKVIPRLSFNLGIRYDYLSPVEDKSGLAIIPALTGNAASAVYNPSLPFQFKGKNQGLYNSDRNNFAPYVGFAWQPKEGLPLVVRGAYSISYVNDDLLRNMSTFTFQNGFQTFSAANQNLGQGTALQSVPAIPTPAFPALTLPALAQQSGGTAPRLFAVDPNLRTPYVQQANLGVESHLKGFLMSVRYVGNRLVKGLISVDRNQVSLSPAFLSAFEQGQQAVNNDMFPNIPGLFGGGLACIQVNSKGQCTRVDGAALFYLQTGQSGSYAQYAQIAGYNQHGAYNFFASPLAANGINLLSNLGRSRYDSLQVSVTRRVSPGLSLTANYVYSKSLSNEDDYEQGAVNPFLDINNPRLDWAPSPFNLKHAFKATAIYNLPFAKNTPSTSWAHQILAGWTISGIAIAQSGAPFSLLSTYGTLNTGANFGLNSAENTVVTNLNASQIQQYFSIQKNPDGTVSYVNTPLTAGPPASQAFQEPGPGQAGNLQRRMFTGPGALNINLGIQKVVSLTERARLEFRAESINVLNKTNWLVGDQLLCSQVLATVLNACNTPGGTVPAFATGQVSQWTPPRSLQFMVRLLF